MSKAKLIEVAYFEAGAPLGVSREIDNGLEAMQALVGGYIELVYLPDGLALICNEEGLLQGLPVGFAVARAVGPNPEHAAWTPICGNFFVARTKGAEFASLKLEDFPRLLDYVRPV